jgi:hypothetical protein
LKQLANNLLDRHHARLAAVLPPSLLGQDDLEVRRYDSVLGAGLGAVIDHLNLYVFERSPENINISASAT